MSREQITGITPRFCYIVLCHRAPEQVLALVHRIKALSPTAEILCRHDQPPGYLELEDTSRAGAYLLRSDIRVGWGGWEMVAATLEAHEAARSTGADWFVIVSGQDWPARDLAEWEQEVRALNAGAVLNAGPIAANPRPGVRITEDFALRARYYDRWRKLPATPLLRTCPLRLRSIIRKVILRISWHQRFLIICRLPRDLGYVVGHPRLRTPFGGALRCVKGEQWLALSADGYARLRQNIAEQPKLVKYYRTTFIPDESFIQTILVNDPEVVVHSDRVSWHEFVGLDPHPLDLTLEHIPAVAASRAPFARKLTNMDGPVRQTLDLLSGQKLLE